MEIDVRNDVETVLHDVIRADDWGADRIRNPRLLQSIPETSGEGHRELYQEWLTTTSIHNISDKK